MEIFSLNEDNLLNKALKINVAFKAGLKYTEELFIFTIRAAAHHTKSLGIVNLVFETRVFYAGYRVLKLSGTLTKIDDL